MKQLLSALALSVSTLAVASAQSPRDLNLQIHGYATQALVYTDNNNWDTMDSSDGSAAWTEAVVNVSVQPASKFSFGVQARYFLLGSTTNSFTLDWANADYRFNDRVGFRVGKVKSPAGMLNQTQDVDPAHLWVLLPQSVYAISSRSSLLSHYGGVGYGHVSLGESGGKLNYFGYGGERVVGGGDGLFQPLRDKGITLPNGATGPMYGAVLNWATPLHGLMLGASIDSEHTSGAASKGALSGFLQASHFHQPFLYGRYERSRLMVGGEYLRQALIKTTTFVNGPIIVVPKDQRAFYAMASYKVTAKLSGGLYYSSSFDERLPQSSARFQKDWAYSSRFDPTSYLYLKLEEHFVNGTEMGFSTIDNLNGLKPRFHMTLFKLGVTF
jgi:hypothetical protein